MPIVIPDNVKPVKVRLACPNSTKGEGELVWVYPTENNQYIMGNIPADKNLPGLGDSFILNEHDDSFSVTKKVSRTGMLLWNTDGCNNKEELIERYKPFYNHLEGKGVQVEGAVAGMVMIAIPVELSNEELEQIIKDCPNIILPESEEDWEHFRSINYAPAEAPGSTD